VNGYGGRPLPPDLRGRFDYASVSGESGDDVERLAVLVLSDDRGAVIREVSPPKR